MSLQLGCRKQPIAESAQAVSEVNSELSTLRRHRMPPPDAGMVSTMTGRATVQDTPAEVLRDVIGHIGSNQKYSDTTEQGAPKTRRRVRLPPPLRPASTVAPPEAEAPMPCTIVVSRICSILTEGAEECAEARQRLRRLDDTEAQSRCAHALAWYEKRFSEERRPRPCALLADVVCRKSGQHSIPCRRAKDEVPFLRKTMQHACKAGILVTLAFNH
ncbi:MAG: hypothetical protein VX223_07790 [Myxococcota bacterium]|nr:hypothetical protein [Myxococcota bacterium]